MRQLRRIPIGENTYPICIDLNVLQQIQEKYITLSEFEKKLLGLVYVKDEKGENVYDNNGKKKVVIVEPSVEAMKFILPRMINEGLAIESEMLRKPIRQVTDTEIEFECEIPLYELQKIIYEEYQRCFATKK